MESTFETMQERAVLVGLNAACFTKEKTATDESLEELEALLETAGGFCTGKVLQNRATPDAHSFIGEGKAIEVKLLAEATNSTMVIFDNELSGSKSSNISNALGVKVVDRSMLILDIFAGRARTNEGKLQVELAQLKYSLPRLGAYLESSGRYGGGVGMRGPGETKLELNRRIVEQNILKKSEELKKLQKHRELNRKSRRENSKPTISIVGYTNSGKSTLLNNLAKADVYVKDELFATLDTTTRNVWLDYGKEVLCTDTVGFINNLPHEFVEAFASTLEESIYSDLIMQVVDLSNPEYQKHITVTNTVLKNLKCQSPMLMVFNKIDKADEEIRVKVQAEYPNGIFISAKNNQGIDDLKSTLTKVLFK
jgi:GTP-binding protein HflX